MSAPCRTTRLAFCLPPALLLAVASPAHPDSALIETGFITAHLPSTVSSRAYEPNLSADGQRIVFGYWEGGSHWSLRIVEADSSVRVLLDTVEIEPYNTPRPVWSPDGRRIAYLASDRDSQTPQLFAVDLADTSQVQLTHLDGTLAQPSWSPLGDRLAVQMLGADHGPLQVVLVTLDGAVRYLAAATAEGSPGRVSWTPDDSRIYYGTEDGIYSIGADGTEVRQVVAGDYRGPAVSADGRTLAMVGPIGPAGFPRYNPDDAEPPHPALYTLDLDEAGAEPRLAVFPYWFVDTGLSNPCWLADGQRLVFTLSRRLYSVDVSEARLRLPDQILEGSFLVRSQQELAALLDPNSRSCSLIGSLQILDSDLIDLSPLMGLRNLVGGLVVENNAALTSLRGLDSLRAVHNLPGTWRRPTHETSLVVNGNDRLADASALAGLRRAYNLTVASSPSLNGLDLNRLTHASSLNVQSNDSLTSVDLGHLEHLYALRVQANDRLERLQAPVLGHAHLTISSNERLRRLDFPLLAGGRVRLTDLPLLSEVNGLSRLSRTQWLIITDTRLRQLPSFHRLEFVGEQLDISRNDSLETLDGLGSIQTVAGIGTHGLPFLKPHLRIADNPRLRSIEALIGIYSTGTSSGPYLVEIGGNPLVPNDQVRSLLAQLGRRGVEVDASVEWNRSSADVPDDARPWVVFPNPTRSTASIVFYISGSGGTIRGDIFAITGQHVITLHDGWLPPGRNSLTWDGRDDRGQPVASGHYLLSIERHKRPWLTQRIALVR